MKLTDLRGKILSMANVKPDNGIYKDYVIKLNFQESHKKVSLLKWRSFKYAMRTYICVKGWILNILFSLGDHEVTGSWSRCEFLIYP